MSVVVVVLLGKCTKIVLCSNTLLKYFHVFDTCNMYKFVRRTLMNVIHVHNYMQLVINKIPTHTYFLIPTHTFTQTFIIIVHKRLKLRRINNLIYYINYTKYICMYVCVFLCMCVKQCQFVCICE